MATQRSGQRQWEMDDVAMGVKVTETRSQDGGGWDQIRKDKWNLALLLLLYSLQGVPLGLAGSVPMVLQARKIGYKQQALFSFVSWPFSVKLIWAPIVDVMYSHTFGRRKSWLIPIQYIIGIVMVVMSAYIDDLIGDNDFPPNVLLLTIVFFMLFVCAATQDIVVDGWALTMLSRENVGHASTCNSVGQTTGYFLGYTVFLVLESAEFCNRFLRWEPQDTGIVDMSCFFFVWGMVFILVTTMVGLFKKEKRAMFAQDRQDLFSAYNQLVKVVKLTPVRKYAVFLLMAKIGFAAAENVSGPKLIEAGLPREKIALMAVTLVPVQILLPFFISKLVAGPRPLDLYIRAIPIRLLFSVIFAFLVWWTSLVGTDGQFPYYYYVTLIILFLIHQVSVYTMFVAVMGFHARVSDPTMGGTYMTLLNTLTNLGGTLAGTSALYLVDIVSWKGCEGVTDLSLDCATKQELEACTNAGGHCVTYLDGYYVETMACFIIGILLFAWQKRRATYLQGLPHNAWRVSELNH